MHNLFDPRCVLHNFAQTSTPIEKQHHKSVIPQPVLV